MISSPFSMLSIESREAHDLAAERLDRVDVVVGGLLVGTELRERVRHGQQRLLHGGIEQAALAQREPRRQSCAIVRRFGVGPADAEQRLVRERPAQAHPLQRRLRFDGPRRLQPGITQRDVGFVAQGVEIRILGIELTDLVEHARTGFDLTEPHERNADVVLRVAHPRIAGPTPRLERRQRVGEAALLHEHLRVEHLALGLELLGQLAGDACECRFRLVQIAALLPDLREEIPRAIVQRGLDGLLQHALENFAGKPVLAVRQVQAAEHELGFGAVVLELTALLRGQQARQRREIVFLEKFEQDLAVSEILDDDAVVIIARRDRVGGGQRECRCRHEWRGEPPPATPTP